MTIECKVVYSSAAQTYMAQTLGSVAFRATATAGDKQAAEALGRKLLGTDFARAELSGRIDFAVYYRLVAKSEEAGDE